ncbi:hypothetical protein E2C01_032403 [Portunus trituberculatus]|uniref:Uncharacterized protein n=1 Tax=Portunus trituberculatus TaxID=210409 RepID=A0A5B7F069_PORTR|nr:hypothetical protein [Portunus trituberculatus]
MDMIARNESEIVKLKMAENRISRIALNELRYTAIEALRGDIGWNTFRERLRIDDERIARKVYLWNESGSKWRNRCMRMTERSGLQVVCGMRMAGRNQNECEWIMRKGGRVGTEWDARKWESEKD